MFAVLLDCVLRVMWFSCRFECRQRNVLIAGQTTQLITHSVDRVNSWINVCHTALVLREITSLLRLNWQAIIYNRAEVIIHTGGLGVAGFTYSKATALYSNGNSAVCSHQISHAQVESNLSIHLQYNARLLLRISRS